MTMYLCFAYDSIYEYNRAIDLTSEKLLKEKKPK